MTEEEAAAFLELGQVSSTLNWTGRKRDSHVSVREAVRLRGLPQALA